MARVIGNIKKDYWNTAYSLKHRRRRIRNGHYLKEDGEWVTA
jgi:hypothetical protein